MGLGLKAVEAWGFDQTQQASLKKPFEKSKVSKVLPSHGAPRPSAGSIIA